MTEKSILEFDSLVDYYIANKVEALPLLKKLVIKQEISFSYEWSIHKHMRQETQESFNFSTFICLIQAEPKYYGNYVECMIEDFKVPEEVIEKCLQHIRSGEVPYQIWIDKCISDLKGSDFYSQTSVPGMLLVYLMKTMRTSIIGYMKLHKALIEEDLSDEIQEAVNAAYIMYSELPKEWKEAYMKLFNTDNERLRRKFHDNELSLFAETLIDMTQYPLNMQLLLAIENGERPASETFWNEPMFKPQGPINRSRIVLEEDEEVPIDLRTGMGDFRELFDDNDSMAIVSDLVEDTKESTPEPVVKEPTEYIVEKVAIRGSSRVMSKNKFDSIEKAEGFIEDVVNAVPDILKSFEFRINGKPYVLERNR